MSFTDYLENAILDHVLGPTPWTAPGTVYIGLSSTLPTDAGGNFTEPSGGSYARVSVANNATQWPNAAAGAKTHANPIQFPAASGAGWGTLAYFGIFDMATGGNLLAKGTLSAPKDVASGDILQFNAGALIVTLD